MSRIILSDIAMGNLDKYKIEPYNQQYTEEYKKIVEKTNKNIILSQRRYALAELKAKFYISD